MIGSGKSRNDIETTHTHWRLEHVHYLWDAHWLILFMLEIPTKRELILNILYLHIHCIIIFLDIIETAHRDTVTCRSSVQKAGIIVK